MSFGRSPAYAFFAAALLAATLGLVACAHEEIASAPPPPTDLEDSVTVRITPLIESLRVGDSVQFRAIVEDTRDTVVTWRILFGSPGSITADGMYRAPATYNPTIRTVNVEVVVNKFLMVKATHRFSIVQ